MFNPLKNYYLRKKFTSFIYTGNEDPHILATLLYPNGAWIKKHSDDIWAMSKKTDSEIWKKRNTIVYNATIKSFSELYASADIFLMDYNKYTVPSAKFDIIQIYDINTPREQIITDMAFKKFVFEDNGYGYKIKKCIVLFPKKHTVGEKVNITDFFTTEDVTKEVHPIWKKFNCILSQDRKSLSQTTSTPVFENNMVYIDYSNPTEDRDNDVCKPEQQYCRARIGRSGIIQWGASFLPSARRKHGASADLTHIEFLINVTKEYNTVYMHNPEFEKAHHREMAKMFPEKHQELYELNKKIKFWENYTPLPSGAPKDFLSYFKEAK